MATVFEARPRATAGPPTMQNGSMGSMARVMAALDLAARQVLEATASCPDERERAAEILAFHARRLHAAADAERYASL